MDNKKWYDHNSFYLIILGFIIILGIFLRFYHLGYNAYWVDELLVVNQINPPFIQVILSQGSDFTPTPKLFLIAIKLVSLLFGNSEWSLRFLPFLFGCLAIPIFFLLCKTLTNKNYFLSIIATIFFAFNLRMLQYSQTLKTYTGEIFFVLSLFYLTELYLDKNYDKKYFYKLLVLSIISLFSFFPMIFIIPAIILRVFYSIFKNRGILVNFRKIIDEWLIYLFLTLISFFINYRFLFPKSGVPLLIYWNNSFLGLNNFFPAFYSGFFGMFNYLFNFLSSASTSYLNIPAIFFILFLGGVIYAFIKKLFNVLIYFFVPLALIVFAALLNQYPFGGIRVDLFLMPLIFFFIANAIFLLFSWINSKFLRYIIISLILIMCLVPIFRYDSLSYDSHREDINQVRVWMDSIKQTTDYIYVSSPTINYFTTFYSRNSYTLISFNVSEINGDWDKEAERVFNQVKGKRLFIFSRYLANLEKPKILPGIKMRCNLLDSIVKTNSAGYLFQC